MRKTDEMQGVHDRLRGRKKKESLQGEEKSLLEKERHTASCEGKSYRMGSSLVPEKLERGGKDSIGLLLDGGEDTLLIGDNYSPQIKEKFRPLGGD